MHYKKLFPPGEFLGPQDFTPPREVTIARVAIADMPERDGKKERAPCMWIVDKEGKEYPRRLKLAKSVITVMSWILGPDYELWAGQKITLKGAWCLSFGEVEECVRIDTDPQMTAKIGKWLKKRKSSPMAWECKAPNETKPTNGA